MASEVPSPSPTVALFRPWVHLASPIGPIVVNDFDGDGDLDIAGVDIDGTVTLLLGDGDGSFAAAAHLPGGAGPASIAAAELNGDGRLDIVVTHTGVSDMGAGDDDIVALLANGDGTFTRIARPARVNPQAVVVADFNGDKTPDLATANEADHLSIFLGRGDGTFDDPENLGSGGPFSSGIAAADFNGDGNLDLVLANSLIGRGRSARTVSVVLGGGDGTFGAPATYDVGGPQPILPVVADLNGDGAADIAMPDGFPTKSVSVLLGNRDGTFSSSAEFAVGPNPHTLVAADLDGDGHIDLVTGNLGEMGGPVGKGISILFGVGDGTFGSKVDLTGPGPGEGIGAAADLDGDGMIDLIVIGDNELVLLFNAGAR